MSTFKDPLILEDVGDGTFILKKSFSYSLGEIGSDITIVVPENFRTDLASIPGIVNWLVPKLGKYNKGAVVHDFLYQKVRENKFNRAVADSIFLEIMGNSGVRFTQRCLIYFVLRLFGWSAIKLSKPMNKSIVEQNIKNGLI